MDIKSTILSLFTEKDNLTLDPVAIWGHLFGISSIGIELWVVVVEKASFDITQFLTAAGILIASIGAAKSARAITKSETGT
ncbi:hypothetical protein UFOVP28_40 [uncultured Caudovirales phage]|uniref:Uncharacterized protein n=1 Tax=uncultured Caudovirales phage TaxID=2100421 RepID=A0A6J5KKI5_9CAUD|nr:hypothetical protein UFOVP28_40 [uncultured Caudovirales phage]